jgi:hypothetical protein
MIFCMRPPQAVCNDDHTPTLSRWLPSLSLAAVIVASPCFAAYLPFYYLFISMTNYLGHLQVDVLRHVLIFVASDVKTMLRCELLCRALHVTVQDDKRLEFLPGVRGWKDSG